MFTNFPFFIFIGCLLICTGCIKEKECAFIQDKEGNVYPYKEYNYQTNRCECKFRGWSWEHKQFCYDTYEDSEVVRIGGFECGIRDSIALVGTPYKGSIFTFLKSGWNGVLGSTEFFPVDSLELWLAPTPFGEIDGIQSWPLLKFDSFPPTGSLTGTVHWINSGDYQDTLASCPFVFHEYMGKSF